MSSGSAELNDAKSIFGRALELGPAERPVYLDQVCGADLSLRAEVEQLLEAADEAGAFMDRPAVGTIDTAPLPPIAEGPGTVIGPYKLMEQIGEGGFGLVFVAEQQRPVRRKVALKIIKPGMDTRDVIARFEAERQALALMDHPNIAKVFDAGATDSGRPYFVMELVRGIPITDYCDQHRLAPRERLELFISVCHAIQHAHQKGIIHRDVKPTNVLVTLHDGVPVVKVIDFGVAKALSQQLTERTVYTQFAQMLGTPLYMSPEQAEMSGLDIDTRSDIYSLGVLLYELLIGTTPFDRERLKRAAVLEIRRILCEEEPPKPSTRLTQSGDRLSSIAAQRNTEPIKLAKLIRGDLDWIVMKCLEKDRNRRYETANGLARDIERHLRDEPVHACPPSFRYRIAKFARRYRVAVVSAAGVLVCLIVLTVSLTYALQESHTADRVRAEQHQTIKALAKAEHYRGLAERSSAILALERGLNYCEQGEIAHGLLWLGRSLEGAPAGATDLQYVARANIGAWQTQLGYWLRHILEHNGPVQAVAISPDGTTALTGANDYTARLWDVASSVPVGEPLRHRRKDVRAACFSPDGKLILTAENYASRLWDAASRRPLGDPIQFDQIILATSFSPDGTHFAVAVEGGAAFLLNTASRHRVGELSGIGYPSNYVCFRPDGEAIVLGSKAQVWNLPNFKPLASLNDQGITAIDDRVTTAVYRRGGDDTILLGFESGRVFAWQPGNQTSSQFGDSEKFHRLPMEHAGRATAIGYAPNGGPLWSADGEGKVRFWNANSYESMGVPIQHRTTVNAVAVTPDGSAVLTGSADGRARVWDLRPPNPPARLASPARGLIGLAFSPDGKTLATGAVDGTVELWDVRTGTKLGQVREHPQMVFDVCFSPDGELLLTCCRDRVARLWRVDGDVTPSITFKHKNPVLSAAFSPDGRRVVSGAGDGVVQVWDPTTGDPLTPPMKHRHMVHSVAFSPDGTRVLTGCEDGTATIWNAATGERDGEPLVHGGPVRDVAWSPDGTIAIAGVWGDGTAWLWDVATRRPITPPLLHREHVVAVAYHPGGKLVATASADGTARLWDTVTGKPIGQLMAIQKNLGLRAVAFSPDGKSIAVGALQPGGVRLWEVPAPAEGTPQDIVRSIEILTGMKLDKNGLFQMLDATRWKQLRGEKEPEKTTPGISASTANSRIQPATQQPVSKEVALRDIAALENKGHAGMYDSRNANREVVVEVAQKLADFLSHPEGEVRYSAVLALREIDPLPASVVPALTQCLKDANFGVRWSSAKTLGRMGEAARPAVPLLKEALQDTNDDVRLNAAAAIWSLEKDRELIMPVLIDVVKENKSSGYHVGEAALLLCHVDPEHEEVVPALMRAVKEGHPHFHPKPAALELAKLGPRSEKAIPALKEALNKKGILGADREEIRKAIEKIETAVGEKTGAQ